VDVILGGIALMAERASHAPAWWDWLLMLAIAGRPMP
jgi:hypothetical protein